MRGLQEARPSRVSESGLQFSHKQNEYPSSWLGTTTGRVTQALAQSNALKANLGFGCRVRPELCVAEPQEWVILAMKKMNV